MLNSIYIYIYIHIYIYVHIIYIKYTPQSILLLRVRTRVKQVSDPYVHKVLGRPQNSGTKISTISKQYFKNHCKKIYNGYIIWILSKDRFWPSMLQSYLTVLCCPQALSRVQLWDPMDCSLPGPSFQGILQARMLELVAIFCSSLSHPNLGPVSSTTLFRNSGVSQWAVVFWFDSF